MKQTKGGAESFDAKKKHVIPQPPLLPPLPKFCTVPKQRAMDSVTKQEIAEFWRQKQIEEEDHLLAAMKAAARVRARNLTEEDYKRFEVSLENDKDEDEDGHPKVEKLVRKDATTKNSEEDVKNNEVHVGIKDWWTESMYAYLNQPAKESCMETLKRKPPLTFPIF
ncbi:Big [Quillaja saponaria]|uniref:Big n=1 Tax=Quillaja saponaria TaxID=32244 RepID=A0AAD7PFN8_QUISA|nr:Big [Quillaja saponaria]